MACCGRDATDDMIKAKGINKDIQQERRKFGKHVKLLLLGAGDSGKSTFAKQLKIMHVSVFSEEERMSYKSAIANNVLTSIRTLIHHCGVFQYSLSKDNQGRASTIMSIPKEQDPFITPELGENIRALWQDLAIKKTFDRSSEYQLHDSTSYYFDRILVISQPNYIPDQDDVLRSRVKTTGILEIDFKVEDIHFKVIDVGGQRSERRKWIHCFEDVRAIIFCVALSEYDLKLYEDNETNRMHESLQLFRDLCATPFFKQTNFIIFLNKMDLFREKIKRVSLYPCFLDYTPPTDKDEEKLAQHGMNFIKTKFEAIADVRKLLDGNKQTLYTHFTCATDSSNVKVVFDSVRDMLLSKTLREVGLM